MFTCVCWQLCLWWWDVAHKPFSRFGTNWWKLFVQKLDSIGRVSQNIDSNYNIFDAKGELRRQSRFITWSANTTWKSWDYFWKHGNQLFYQHVTKDPCVNIRICSLWVHSLYWLHHTLQKVSCLKLMFFSAHSNTMFARIELQVAIKNTHTHPFPRYITI